MKCIPITCVGRVVAAAIFVIEMEEVFVAKILPAGTTSSSFRKRESFNSSAIQWAASTRDRKEQKSNDTRIVCPKAEKKRHNLPISLTNR